MRFAGFLVWGLLLTVGSTAAESGWPAVVLEPAPRDLGALRTEGFLLLQAHPGGGEILLLDDRDGKLYRFGETGHQRGDPLLLRTASGETLPDVIGFAAGGSQLAIATPFKTLLYTEDGRYVAEKPLVFPADITAKKVGSWVLSLGATPRSESNEFFGRGEFTGLPPRLIELGTKLKLGRTGLPMKEADRAISGSRALGRNLSVAWSGDHLYAAELANYTVYELGSSLQLRATFRDPELALESDGGARQASRLERNARHTLDHLPGDAAKPDGTPAKKPRTSAASNQQNVIRDIAWHSASNRLAILIQRDVLDTGPVLDLLDPQTGEVERFYLKVPDGLEGQQPISQIAVGDSYVWLRAHSGSQQTWRVSHALLVDGERLKIPEVEGLAVDEADEP
jgi:hypothetical protein